MKALEKADVAKGRIENMQAEEEPVKPLSEVEEILLETDVNTLSPMQALLLLNDLKQKIGSGN